MVVIFYCMELKITEKLLNQSSPTICLNMIVKNESKIITRMLDSVLSIIDCYCICDTGSTDNTIEIIKTYFEEKWIPGRIIQEPFVNFGYNRTFALKACAFMSDYVLLMDADMVLDVRTFDKKKLINYDVFTILQGNNSFYYFNSRIVKNSGECRYLGVTHEYLDVPSEYNTCGLSKEEIFIIDVGDGGCKTNKWNRDVLLLVEGIKQEPENGRYYFYLGNTYYDMCEYEKAIKCYKKRIDLKGWKEEVWYSFYKIGMCYKQTNKWSEACHYWMEGFQFYPERLEGLYEMLVYYRTTSKYKLFEMVYNSIKPILELNHNRDKCLFVHNDVYVYKIYYEYTIVAFYLENEAKNEVMNVLQNCNDINITRSLLSNLKFYNNTLLASNVIKFDNKTHIDMYGEMTEFISSSSCLISNGRLGYVMNVRYVNYTIGKHGEYYNCDKHIITQNKLMLLDNELNLIDDMFVPLSYTNKKYIGIEDIRLFRDVDNNILFIGTVLKENGELGVGTGKYHFNDELKYVELTKVDDANENAPIGSKCEKNWTYVIINNEPHIVYNWYPMHIYSIKENNIHLKMTINMPLIYSYVRGSTCGCQFHNEIWFVSHITHNDTPREYYHIISVFDINMNLLRYSSPFKFEGESIEFCLSIIVESKRVLINYSTWDRTTRIGIYDKNYVDKLVCYGTGNGR